MGCLIKWEEHSKVDFICPECGIIPPEIMNINVDNKNVEFLCMKCAENEYNSQFFSKIIEKNETCYYCKVVEEDERNKHWLKEYRDENQRIKVENNYLEDKALKDSIEIIEKKNEQIKKIIKFNNIIKQNCEEYQNNYLYFENFKNICESFRRENIRDSNDLKFLFTAFNNEIELSNNAISEIWTKKRIKIERETEDLLLNNNKLNDENIKCISKIKFNQLKEIDLSKNEITSIESFCNINLPFLEFLNLSNNKIKNIEPLEDKNLKQLKYLFIQNNLIEDINVFLNNNFPTFQILRLENNKIEENSDSLGKLNKIYKKKRMILIQNTKQIDRIKRKYNIEYNENVNEIAIEETEEGDIVLKYLFIIITYNNKIRKLKLKSNKIEDPSILNRIHFKFLEELDLSCNNIKNLNFLKKMKSKKLNKLFLNDNKIYNISLLYDIKKTFPYLETITFNNNNFSPEDSRYTNLIQKLNSLNVKTQNQN